MNSIWGDRSTFKINVNCSYHLFALLIFSTIKNSSISPYCDQNDFFFPHSKCMFHISLNSSNTSEEEATTFMIVAASCCKEAFVQQRLGNWSELMSRWTETDTVVGKKPVGGSKRLELGVEVNLPTGERHTGRTAMQWFRIEDICVLEWVSQSQDLNPVENLWQDLK